MNARSNNILYVRGNITSVSAAHGSRPILSVENARPVGFGPQNDATIPFYECLIKSLLTPRGAHMRTFFKPRPYMFLVIDNIMLFDLITCVFT